MLKICIGGSIDPRTAESQITRSGAQGLDGARPKSLGWQAAGGILASGFAFSAMDLKYSSNYSTIRLTIFSAIV
jgi:hypothetical protein